MPKRPHGARHALTRAQKRSPDGWFSPNLRARVPESLNESACWWCLMPYSEERQQTGVLWDGHTICDPCATRETR